MLRSWPSEYPKKCAVSCSTVTRMCSVSAVRVVNARSRLARNRWIVSA